MAKTFLKMLSPHYLLWFFNMRNGRGFELGVCGQKLSHSREPCEFPLHLLDVVRTRCKHVDADEMKTDNWEIALCIGSDIVSLLAVSSPRGGQLSRSKMQKGLDAHVSGGDFALAGIHSRVDSTNNNNPNVWREHPPARKNPNMISRDRTPKSARSAFSHECIDNILG